jgi:hypothetical protein
MKKNLLINTLMLAAVIFFASSCEAIGGIFKAGVWSGVLLVAGIIALVIFIISRMGGKK